jgi:DNA-binding SARP family transcriptional activator/tetratricopeptide (TPR) repeat protein
MTASVEFRVLGSLEVFKDGAILAIRAPRQQALLAVLALEANHVVPVSRLVDTIWGEHPPATARCQVQICISSLRKLIKHLASDEIIVTHASGYQLCAVPETVDAIRFEQLVALGRSAAEEHRLGDAVCDLRAALELWHGPAAAGIDSQVVQIAATRLNEQRIAATEACITLELQLGRHTELIAELTMLVAENPLREKLRALQMLALYRAGRQADALEAYRSVRSVFVAELGIEPGKELRQLMLAILQNDTSLEFAPGAPDAALVGPSQPAATGPYQLPADVADFTGREDISERLRALLAPAVPPGDPGRPMQVVVLTGMGGVGKTALAVHLAHTLKDRFPDGQLFLQMRGHDTRPVGVAQALGRCLRAIGMAPSVLPTDQAELAEMYRNTLARRRILVVLDDAASVAQVTPLLPGNPNCAVIVTSRRRLSGLIGAHFPEVGLLPPNIATALLARILAHRRPAAISADIESLARLCGYLPLALRIVGAKLLEHPHWTPAQMIRKLQNEKGRLAELQIGDIGVKTSISLSYENLTTNAKRLFLRLAILGGVDFGSWTGSPLMDLDIEQSNFLFDELVTCRLVEVRHRSDELTKFYLHDLVRDFAIERLATDQSVEERAAALRRLLGCWLFLATEGHRREYGGDFMILHGSAAHWTLPGHVAAELLHNPLDWFRGEHQALMSAIGMAAQADLHELCWDLATTSVILFDADSLFDDWRRSHDVALKAVLRAGNVRGEASIMCSLAELALVRQRIETARSYLIRARKAFDAVGDIHGRALAASHMAIVDRLNGNRSGALARYSSALEDLRSVRDQVSEGYVLSGMAQVHLEREEHEIAERQLSQALTLCGGLAAKRVEAQATYRAAELYLAQGEIVRAERAFSSSRGAALAGGDRMGEAYALHGHGVTLTMMGNLGPAGTDLSTALEMARELGNRVLEERVLLALRELAAEDGSDSSGFATLAQAFDALRVRPRPPTAAHLAVVRPSRTPALPRSPG